MNIKIFVYTAIISVVTSTAVCLIVSPGLKPKTHPDYLAVRTVDGEDLFIPRSEISESIQEKQSLWSAVGHLRAEVAELKKDRQADVSQAKEGVRTLRELLSSKHINNEIVADAIGRIMRNGITAVEEIVQFLLSGKNVDLGGPIQYGRQVSSFPDLKTALLYTLYGIGTTSSRKACFDHLASRASLIETAYMLSYFNSAGVDEVWHGLLKEVLKRDVNLISKIHREDLEGISDPTSIVYGVCMHLDRINVPSAASLLREALDKGVFDECGEAYLINGILAVSPEEGIAAIERKLLEANCDRQLLIALAFSGGSGIPRMPARIEAARLILATGLLSPEEKSQLYVSLSNSADFYGKNSPRRTSTEVQEHLRELLTFLETCASTETDPEFRDNLHQGIINVKKRIK